MGLLGLINLLKCTYWRYYGFIINFHRVKKALFLTNPPVPCYLFFFIFFRGESSSEPFLPLPRDPRFSRSPLDSASALNIHVYRDPVVCIYFFTGENVSITPTYFSVLFHRCFHNHSLPVSPLIHFQILLDQHPVCEYVCPPIEKDFMEIRERMCAFQVLT